MSIKDLAINQNQSRLTSSANCIRKMSVRIVCLLMIETPIEIYLNVDRCRKFGTFRDRESHARMCHLTI